MNVHKMTTWERVTHGRRNYMEGVRYRSTLNLLIIQRAREIPCLYDEGYYDHSNIVRRYNYNWIRIFRQASNRGKLRLLSRRAQQLARIYWSNVPEGCIIVASAFK